LIGLSAGRVPLPDASFDTVLITYTCTIPDPHAALLEMRRVLAPTGKLLYCEHGARRCFCTALARAFAAAVGQGGRWLPFGARCTRHVAGAGFALPDLQTRYITGPHFARLYSGEALPA